MDWRKLWWRKCAQTVLLQSMPVSQKACPLPCWVLGICRLFPICIACNLWGLRNPSGVGYKGYKRGKPNCLQGHSCGVTPLNGVKVYCLLANVACLSYNWWSFQFFATMRQEVRKKDQPDSMYPLPLWTCVYNVKLDLLLSTCPNW